MSASPEAFALLGQVAIAGVAIGAPITGIVVWIHKMLGKKADKHAVGNQVNEVKLEQGLHRTYFKDVFEKMEEHARRDEQLFREVMSTMHSNHSELLREIGKKADR